MITIPIKTHFFRVRLCPSLLTSQPPPPKLSKRQKAARGKSHGCKYLLFFTFPAQHVCHKAKFSKNQWKQGVKLLHLRAGDHSLWGSHSPGGMGRGWTGGPSITASRTEMVARIYTRIIFNTKIADRII